MGAFLKKISLFFQCPERQKPFPGSNSYPDFLIIPTISGKADNYGLLLKKGRDNFFIKGRYPTARMQILLRKKS